MFPVFLQSIAETRKAILYRPEFNLVTGSVTASILLNQIIFWAAQGNGEPFYKFQQPCGHEKYRDGDSWCEELGFSRKEFLGAIAKIGTKVIKGVSKTDAFKGESPQNLVIYWTDASRVTWWQLNIDLAEKLISGIYLDKAQKGIYLGNAQKGIYLVSTEKGFTYSSTENTTKNITEKRGEEPQPKTGIPKIDPTQNEETPEKKLTKVVEETTVVAPRVQKYDPYIHGRVSALERQKAIAANNISAFKSPEEKAAFGEWAKGELGRDYSPAIALDKAGWAVRNLDQNKQDDLLAVDLLKRYRSTSVKSGQQSTIEALVAELVAIAKSNPSEAQKRANALETSEGKPENFYWNKVLGEL